MPGAFTDEGGSSRRPTEEVVERLRSALLAAHYDEVGISEATGTPVGYTFPITESAVDLRRVIGGDRLHNLIRLFLCGGTISGASAAEALGELSLNEGAKAGLIKLGGDQVSSPVRIHAWRNLLIASDRGRQAPDLVTGVNPAAITLANLTIRADAEKTLDLGTGCGIQGLLAAAHSRQVVATDINPRALWFAALNCGLNGVGKLDLRRGSWFDPVTERFNLIVANPPFVISPDSLFAYRDSGLPEDAVSAYVIARIPEHLVEGGFACVLCNWVQSREGAWWRRPASWAAGRGCDVLILRHAIASVVNYAAAWNLELRGQEPQAFEQAVDRWLAYYQGAGIDTISSGAIFLRRRSGPPENWVVGLECADGPSGPASEHLLGVFSGQDYLQGLPGDRAMLAQAFRPADGHVLDQRLSYRDGTYLLEPSVMRPRPALGLQGQVDARLVQILMKCDGRRPLSNLVTEVANGMGFDEAELVATCLREFRQLISLGLLTAGSI